MKENVMRKLVIGLLTLACLVAGTAAFAAVSGGLGTVAENVRGSVSAIAKLVTAAAYVIGMAFAVGAIIKFKAHKDNPTQIPIGTPVALLFVGAALIFVPTVFKVSGSTLFGEGATVGGVSGVTEIK
jgi:intracellular multiplication protein IcmD